MRQWSPRRQLGVSGNGTITTAGGLKIAGVADPLGSWTNHADVGVMDFAHKIIQEGSSFLYEVEVRGTVDTPDVKVTGGKKLIGNDKDKAAK